MRNLICVTMLLLIVPGRPDESILLYRLESSDPGIRMPSVGRNLAPLEAVALVRDWIAAMPTDSELPLDK